MKGEERSSKAEQGSKTKEAEHLISRCQNFRTPDFKVRKFRIPQNQGAKSLAKGSNFRTPQFQGAKSISRSPKDTPRTSCEISGIPNSHLPPFRPWQRPEEAILPPHPHPTPRPHRAAMGAATSPPVQAPAIPLSEGEAPSQRRAATEEPQIPVENTPETIIRRPMIAGPPIEGNLDCRDRPFHSETYFDIEALRQQQSSEIHSDCCRGLRNPTLIQFTIDGRQGAIGARHIAEALRIPYEPVFQADFREWSSFSQSDMVRILSRGTSTASVLTRRELPSGMLLIDVLLRANLFPLQHKKKLQRADAIPLLFPRLLCQILEHLGYPEEPRLERRRHCREDFSLDKWHHLVAYFAPEGAPAVPAPPELPRDDQLPQAQQDEILTETTPPTLQHTPQCTCPRLYILLPLSLRRLSAFIADTEHCSGFYYPPDGHYSCTPGLDHCYSDPAYHDPSSDSAASEYADSS
ncbi:hypothetical protein CK203_062216 [Vitis vinifera]|uniref:Uncharacterized protein n=1 Tax=Vitis vinifera TaxID=29760 RepID=A0A438G796_VITVI|nr:hypothetical protein CK203_062216 [Vitis vinifera]